MIDQKALYDQIVVNTKKAIFDQFPVEGKTRTLEVKDVAFQPMDYSIDDEYDSVYKEKTLSSPVYAHMVLKDKKSGNVLDEVKKMKIMNLPVVSSRGTFMIRGNEYTVGFQNRIRPGIYPIKKQTGEIEGKINASKGMAQGMGILLQPKDNQFKLLVGQSRKPLYPVLKAVGLSDGEISDAWGKDLFSYNSSITPDELNRSIVDTARKFSREPIKDVGQAKKILKEKFKNIILDGKINKETIGSNSKNLSNEALLGTTRKLIAINRGKSAPVDRNDLKYKDFLGVDDFIGEKIGLHNRKIKRRILNKVDNDDKLKIRDMITSSYLTKPVESFFTDSSLAEIGDQYNPLDIISSANKVTAMGEGGITKENAITEDMRALHTSHAGFLDPIQTPESEKIGVNLHVAAGIKKKGKRLVTKMFNVRTRRFEDVEHNKTSGKVVALPGASIKKGQFTTKTIRALKDGKVQLVPAKDVDYIVSKPQQLFSVAVNLIPGLNNNSGGRMFMASKQMGQAISLKDREAPLVQSGIDGKKSWSQMIGDSDVPKAPVDGVITRVDSRYVHMMTPKGEKVKVPYYKNFPLNSNHFKDTTIDVKKGDNVKAGQMLGDTNFTRGGTLALGTNLRTAFIPDGGYNFEDGITISESASKKLSSQHLYKKKFRSGENVFQSRKMFVAKKPNEYMPGQLDKLDDGGIVKEGQIVQPGDPLVLALRKAEIDKDSLSIGDLSRKLKNPWRASSEVWDGTHEGVVSKVIKDDEGGVKVYVKSLEAARVADKLAGRYGNKGVISRILPDDRMPTDKDGNPMEILLNPLTVPSRINIGQGYEAALSKIADKTGKPVILESFDDEDTNKKIISMLKEHGIDEDGAEDLYDADGKKLGRVLTGKQYMLKLSKQAKTNFSARGAGPGEGYDLHKSPSGGGERGAKALDILSIYALLSHGATANLREMSTDKASANPDFWQAVKSGLSLPAPQQTHAYKKFVDYLKVAGVNVERKGNNLQFIPFTDDDIMKVSGGAVSKPKFINAKDLKEKKGGLMDKKIFGGINGQQWGHIELAEPVINPLFRHGARDLLGVKDKELSRIVAERGGRGIQELLGAIDLVKIKEETEAKLEETTSPQTESKLNKRLHYIEALKGFKINPVKAYTLTKVPVLPPSLRPVVGQADGNQVVTDINYLYRDLMLTNNAFKKLNKINHIPDRLKKGIRSELQAGVEALAGIVKPTGVYDKGRTPEGVVQQLKGKKAKEGFFQNKVIRKTLDVTGRGVITPDPKIGMDQVGIPEKMAWEIYSPFVEGRLRKLGIEHKDIMKMMKDRSAVAKQALEKEMEYRPVILNRPPSLHKFSMMAFKPHLVKGETIKIPSLVVGGFNADFDGDALMVHVPTRPEAVAEAKEKMLPSSNIFNPREGAPIVVPSGEAFIGLYRASNTAEGRAKIKDMLPDDYKGLVTKGMTGHVFNKILGQIGKESPGQYKDTVEALKGYGDDVAWNSGFSFTLKDLDIMDKGIDDAKKSAFKEYMKNRKDPEEVAKILGRYNKKIGNELMKHTDNPFVEMVYTKSRAKTSQIQQMLASPLQYTDANKNVIPTPVMSNFANGMGINDYWTTLYSARRGMIEKKMETRDPGAFAKQLLINTSRMTANDAKELDDEGEVFDVMDRDAHGRIVAKNIRNDKGTILMKKGDVLTPNAASRLLNKGVRDVNIHTVLSSTAPRGVTPAAYGLTASGKLLQAGDNIGSAAGQAIAEPLQQGAMKSFHTAGVIGGDSLNGFDRIKTLLTLPSSMPHKAALAPESGVITSIKANPAGGSQIFFHNMKEPIVTAQGNKLKVKKGDTVDKGTVLSEGFIHPRDVLETQGMMATRKHLVKELKDGYRAMGVNIDRRNLEVIVRSLTDTTKVKDSGDSDFIKGDVVSFDQVKYHNSRPPIPMKVTDSDIKGKRLSRKVSIYPKGTLLTQPVINDLKSHSNLGSIDVVNDPIIHDPILVGMVQLPKKTGDWATQLASGNIKKELQHRVPAGESANIHGTSPMAGFMYGTEFGLGRGGNY